MGEIFIGKKNAKRCISSTTLHKRILSIKKIASHYHRESLNNYEIPVHNILLKANLSKINEKTKALRIDFIRLFSISY